MNWWRLLAHLWSDHRLTGRQRVELRRGRISPLVLHGRLHFTAEGSTHSRSSERAGPEASVEALARDNDHPLHPTGPAPSDDERTAE